MRGNEGKNKEKGASSILGDGAELVAHGEVLWNEWFRLFWGLTCDFAGVF
jgi:hypothetical protein